MKAHARPQPKRGNKTEAEYGWVLRAEQQAGAILEFRYEALTLILGHDCRYTPDYLVVTTLGFLELHEVKGFHRDDAMVKLRVAARLFPWFRFLLVEREGGGGFHREEVTA